MSILLIFAVAMSALEWIGAYRNKKMLVYIATPLVVVSVFSWTLVNIIQSGIITGRNDYQLIWFVLGMTFCLGGDLLFGITDKYYYVYFLRFIIGLGLYIVGLGRIFPDVQSAFPGIVLGIIVAIISTRLYKKFSLCFDQTRKSYLKLPVAAYTVVISIFLFSAMITLLDNNWHYGESLWVTFGALLLYISYVLRVWSWIVFPVPLTKARTMMAHHIGQIALMVGAVLHFIYHPEA